MNKPLEYMLIAALVVLTLILILYIGREVAPYNEYILIEVFSGFAFCYAYFETKDTLFAFLALSCVPMIISDLYFLPNFSLFFPRTNAQGAGGVGMNMYAGIHLLVITIGCMASFRNKLYVIGASIITAISLIFNIDLTTGLLVRGSSVAYFVGWLVVVVAVGYLVYYGAKTQRILFVIGGILWIITMFAVFVYSVKIGSNITPFTLRYSDKLFTISEALLALGALSKT